MVKIVNYKNLSAILFFMGLTEKIKELCEKTLTDQNWKTGKRSLNYSLSFLISLSIGCSKPDIKPEQTSDFSNPSTEQARHIINPVHKRLVEGFYTPFSGSKEILKEFVKKQKNIKEAFENYQRLTNWVNTSEKQIYSYELGEEGEKGTFVDILNNIDSLFEKNYDVGPISRTRVLKAISDQKGYRTAYFLNLFGGDGYEIWNVGLLLKSPDAKKMDYLKKLGELTISINREEYVPYIAAKGSFEKGIREGAKAFEKYNGENTVLPMVIMPDTVIYQNNYSVKTK